MYCATEVQKPSLMTFNNYFPHLSSVCCSLSLSALPLSQDGKKNKKMCLTLDSAVQIVILSSLNTTKTIFSDKIFLESGSFSSV